MIPRFHRRIPPIFTEMTILALLLWPAPIPVGHCHEDCGSRWSGDQMTLHLQTCHGGFANADHWPSDWHWHWVFQTDIAVGTDQGSSSVQCNSVVDKNYPTPLDFVCESYLDAWVWTKTLFAPLVPMDRRHAFTTIALLSSRQSLPELLGIVRC